MVYVPQTVLHYKEQGRTSAAEHRGLLANSRCFGLLDVVLHLYISLDDPEESQNPLSDSRELPYESGSTRL
ncbi:unnamed protein product [Nippostrongylus brasiliensis]|uniref:Uncharacterized protein n=1 Tax=Nippostrongylus brasiliensis TaxID=27835 RepID=A0A158R0C7_NIPBR|nr:unnamed protein product [Nippostrongylus brasiliensis]